MMQKGPKHSLKQYGWFHFLYEGGDTQMKQKWHASAVGLCLDVVRIKGLCLMVWETPDDAWVLA